MDRLEADALILKPQTYAAALTGVILMVLAASLSGFSTPSLAQDDTSLSIDTIPTDNTPTFVAAIDSCAAATKGDTFNVDIVIEDVSDLLAWEASLFFNTEVLEVQDSDTEMFQAANLGSQVIDLSEDTPDRDGRYLMQSLDAADPVAPDSGSGVLARLTFTAKANGVSPLNIDKVDLNDDGTFDQGLLLRNVAGLIIGDEDGDTFFDGPVNNAEIRVGEPCPGAEGAKVVTESGNRTSLVLIVGAALGGLTLVLLAISLAVYLRRRRSASP